VQIFREELERAGLEYRPEWVRADLHPNADGVGWSDFREVWTAHRQNKPDGLLIADDQLLRDATRAIRELRVRVPDELHIVSHANKDLPVTRPPFPLAYVEYDPDAQASAIAEMLLKLLRGEPVGERHVQLGYRLIAPEIPHHHADEGTRVRT
jgi:DNA-binding LacI/PurR family transcriptional regulator